MFLAGCALRRQGGGDEVHPLGVHQAGADGVDIHPMGRHLVGQRLGEADDGKLAGAIGAVARDAPLARAGRYVDDFAGAAPGNHMAAHRPADQIGAAHIDPHHLVKGVLIQLHNQHPVPAGAGAGVVDQNVHLPELVERIGQHRVHLPAVGNIVVEAQAAAPHCPDFLHHAGQALPAVQPVFGADGVQGRFNVGNHHIGAFGGQAGGDGAANAVAAAGAGDEGNFAVEVIHMTGTPAFAAGAGGWFWQ